MLLFYMDSIYWTWFHSCNSVNKENLGWLIYRKVMGEGRGILRNGRDPSNGGGGLMVDTPLRTMHTVFSLHHISLNTLSFNHHCFPQSRDLEWFSPFEINAQLNEVCRNYNVWILKWVNLLCNWINLIIVLNFPKQ